MSWKVIRNGMVVWLNVTTVCLIAIPQHSLETLFSKMHYGAKMFCNSVQFTIIFETSGDHVQYND